MPAMTENPYQPPEISLPPPPVSRPLLPLWRRVASVALITLGAVGTLALPANPVMGVIGLVLVFLGSGLRTLPKSTATRAVDGVHAR